MVDTSFNCRNCEAELSFESVVIEVLERDTPKEILENRSELTMDCPECGCDLSVRPSEINVQMTVEEALVALSKALAEGGLKRDRTPDWEAVVEIEQEQAERADRIDELADNL